MQKIKRMILTLVLLFCATLLCATAWAADVMEIRVRLTVPDSAWNLAIDEVHRVGNELWVIAVVSQNPDVMGAQVISTVKASLKLTAPDLPSKYFIIGKTWNWKNEEPYTFIEDLHQIEKGLKTGKLLYKSRKKIRKD